MQLLFSEMGSPQPLHFNAYGFHFIINVRRYKSNKFYNSRVAQGGHMDEPAKIDTKMVIH
jgi:hypothetical protein